VNQCGNCRFWSEMVAYAFGGSPVHALCLSDGTKAGMETTAQMSCEAWKSGHHGAVDSPPNYGEEARAAYEDDEVAMLVEKGWTEADARAFVREGEGGGDR
jgi:hypothetical protein